MSAAPRGNARSRARRSVLQALYQWQMTAESPTEVEAQFFADRPMANVDVEYFQLLLRAIPLEAEALDQLIEPMLDRPLAQVDPVEHAILRIGAYELSRRKEVPLRVVINEAIELAKTFGADQSHKFINGILDRVAKSQRPEGL